ncbi:MAG: SDR family oxidoreductase [Alphaproteobacteria bacterium]
MTEYMDESQQLNAGSGACLPGLFCFGLGYTAKNLGETILGHHPSFPNQHLVPINKGWHVAGTSRNIAHKADLAAKGFNLFSLDTQITAAPTETSAQIPDSLSLIRGVLASGHYASLLISVPPDSEGCPIFRLLADFLVQYRQLFHWVGYLSTTGVYGQQHGEWVDETTTPNPLKPHNHFRLKAENQWLSLSAHDMPIHIFRLSGIYGQGRSAIDKICEGTAQRIDSPGQLFNRIHVDDIVQTLLCSMKNPCSGRVYNVSDDEPAPARNVIEEACRLLDAEPPPLIPLAHASLSAMAQSFYAENKKVFNQRIKQELGVKLLYPTYREGLAQILSITTPATIISPAVKNLPVEKSKKTG